MIKFVVSILAVFLSFLSGCGALASHGTQSASYDAKPLSSLTALPSTSLAVKESSSYSAKEPSTNSKEASRRTIYAAVEHISDGDTITVRTKGGEKIRVRLYAIDAPEKSQPYGPQSTGILKNLIANQYVNIEIVNTDRYGRKVGRVYLHRQDINAEMVRLGAAWHYRAYDKSPLFNQYVDMERTARMERRGLWNKNNPTPPWDYRRMMREKNKK